MKQQNQVIIDRNIWKIKELFMHIFVHVLCIVFVTYFNPFVSKNCFFPVEMKCLGQTPIIYRKYFF